MAQATIAEVHNYLKGLEYPASKGEIIDYARSRGASEEVLSAIEEMPDKEYEDSGEVSKVLK